MSSTTPSEKQPATFNFFAIPTTVTEIPFQPQSADPASTISRENSNNRAFLRASQPNLNLFGVKKEGDQKETNTNNTTAVATPTNITNTTTTPTNNSAPIPLILPSITQTNNVNNTPLSAFISKTNGTATEADGFQYPSTPMIVKPINKKGSSEEIQNPFMITTQGTNTSLETTNPITSSPSDNNSTPLDHEPLNNNNNNNNNNNVSIVSLPSSLTTNTSNNTNNGVSMIGSTIGGGGGSSSNSGGTLIDRKTLAYQDKTNPFASGAADFQHYEKEKQNLMIAELAHLEDFMIREKAVIDLYKSKVLSNLQHNELESITKQFGQDLSAIWSKKSRTLSYIIEGSESNPFKSLYNKIVNQEPTLPQYTQSVKLIFIQQPSENAIANRYMVPAPAVCIEPGYRSHSSSYIVSVSLAYHGAGNEVVTTIDGKHEMLQGIKKVTVDSSGSAIFNKLKIMEVSSKHRHQPFCLVFSLEEYTDQGNKRVISTVKSVPFHVQSRPNKRKSTGSLPFPPAKHFLPASISNAPIVDFKAVSSPNVATLNSHGLKDYDIEMSNSDSVIPKHEHRSIDDNSNHDDENFIDITDLLILPQKEAAKRLGISESMLCKRFKECTKRKWPYRYLRKIDKVINTLTVHKSDSEFKPREDKEKLERLNKERIECLQPVKIRITTGDKLPEKTSSGKWNTPEDEDISDEVLETLETMRMSKNMDSTSPQQPSSPVGDNNNHSPSNNTPPPPVTNNNNNNNSTP